MILLLNIVSAAAAFIAAGLWWWASVLSVKADLKGREIPPGAKFLNFAGGQGPISIEPDGTAIDVYATAIKQGKVNARAAIAAGVAAAAQAIAMSMAAVSPPPQ